MIYLKTNSADWQNLVKGIRKEMDCSQSELSNKVDISRRQIGKYERGYRSPNKHARNEIEKFIERKNFDRERLSNLGEELEQPSGLRTITDPKEIELNPEFAELLGIIIGDGEVSRDGEIRISFNPNNERKYIEDRTIQLLENFLKSEVKFESKKRLVVYDKALVLNLKEVGIEPGSKFDKNWNLSENIRSKQDLRKSVLRGIYDTDGTFYYDGQRTSITFGRFSNKSKEIVELIEELLEKERIEFNSSQSKDTRWKIRITDTIEITKFFRIIGSSNYKHISRYLAWRDKREQVKVSEKSLDKISEDAGISLKDIEVPFKCRSKENKKKIKGKEFRNQENIAEKVEKIHKSDIYGSLAEELDVTDRTVRKWKNGKRNPSPKKSYEIKQIIEA